ncbi:hypothetical protein [Taklimakanibacter lacteus]|uniref:hypothetical protein n=1 Tax=Taklimakanibacter lacteus TaxID=2268456 RepID=UPI0013C43499
MRLTDFVEIHSEAFSARVEAVEALRAAGLGSESGHGRLYGAADMLRSVAQLYGKAKNATLYGAFADIVQIVGLAVEWRDSVLNAKPEASRFITAARERAKDWLVRYDASEIVGGLREVAAKLEGLKEVSEVAKLVTDACFVPLPIGLYRQPDRSVRKRYKEQSSDERPAKLSVAFIKFTIDGIPLEKVHFVSPGELHDLDIEVRVSRWPADSTALILEPVTIERASTYQMPVFSIPAPIGDGPYQLRQNGRAILNVPHHMNARPFEFKYVARFVPQSVEQPVDVVGQRTLLLEGVDLVRNPITGYANLDKKLMDVRDTLRQTAGLSQQEIFDALTLVAPIVNYAGQVVQDNLYESSVFENEFQKRIKSFLRSQPRIGSDLEEHPRAGGGITDLSFKGIRLELKVDSEKPMVLEDCRKFLGQATTYAVASGKRLAILCVLDCSKKTLAPFPTEDGLGILVDQHGSSTTFVIAILLQGNIARPSSLSR